MCPLLWPLGADVRRQGRGLALEASARPGGRTVGQVGPCPVGSRGRGVRAGTRRLRVGWIPASTPPPRAPGETRGSALSLGPPRPARAPRGSPQLTARLRSAVPGASDEDTTHTRHPGKRPGVRPGTEQVLGITAGVTEPAAGQAHPGAGRVEESLSDSHRLPDTCGPPAHQRGRALGTHPSQGVHTLSSFSWECAHARTRTH